MAEAVTSVMGHTPPKSTMEQQRSSLGAARRAEFKSPPSGRPGSQDERRAHALEEQKRVCLHIAIRDFPADVFPS